MSRRDAPNVLLDHPILQRAREDVKLALWQSWLDATTVEDREKIHGTALGFELFYSTLQGYVDHGTAEDYNTQLREAFDVSKRSERTERG